MRGHEMNWKPWGRLLEAVKTGENAFENEFGENLFEYTQKNPHANDAFNETMRATAKLSMDKILDNYQFADNSIIMDVGGGDGLLLSSILQKYPSCRGILFDLAQATKDADNNVLLQEQKSRVKIVSGDMFENIPAKADYIILKRILHDWDDERSSPILKNCRNALNKNGKLLIIDYVINTDDAVTDGKVNDVHMMIVCPGGRERTLPEFEAICNKAGLSIKKIINSIPMLECVACLQ